MKLSELMKLGKLLGVLETEFGDALDAENPLMESRTLVLAAYRQHVEQREKAEAEKSALREASVEKLKQETMRVLRGQAKTVGLTAKQMFEIEDEELYRHHGSSPYAIDSRLTNGLLASQHMQLGHSLHAREPGVYTSRFLRTSAQYARFTNLFGDAAESEDSAIDVPNSCFYSLSFEI